MGGGHGRHIRWIVLAWSNGDDDGARLAGAERRFHLLPVGHIARQVDTAFAWLHF